MSRDGSKSRPARQIEDGLKKVFDSYVEADVPDTFTDLLNQLREKEKSTKASNGEDGS